MRRPAEELYDNSVDPSQLKNIAMTQVETRKRLSDALDKWMKQQGDPGAAMDDFESLEKARNQQHEF